MKINRQKLEVVMARTQTSVTQLAYKSGIAPVTVTRIKNGTQSPNPITAGRIAAALDVDVTEIIEMG